MSRALPLKIGDINGKLTIVNIPKERTKAGAIYTLCDCNCGHKNIRIRADIFRSGKFNNCPGCGIWSSFDKLGYVYSSYKDCSKNRNIEFNLTKEDISKIIYNKCHYCNDPPEERLVKCHKKFKSIAYNGIDRVDSSKGYIIGNVVTCCYKCNIAKSDLTYNEFLNLIKNIYNNLINENKN